MTHIEDVEQSMKAHLDAYNQQVAYSREYLSRADKFEAIKLARYHLHRYAELQRELNSIRNTGEY